MAEAAVYLGAGQWAATAESAAERAVIRAAVTAAKDVVARRDRALARAIAEELGIS